jgi:glycosyltransferase involved in cell wall biosynthesis
MSRAVTVLMPVYRPRLGYLGEAIDSVLRQSFRDFELLLVEAACDEEDVRSQYCELLTRACGDVRVRHLRYPGPASLVDQLNYGLGLARTDLVARMDADDWSHPERLREQVEFLNEHPEVAVVGTQIDIMDERSCPLGRREYPTEVDAIAACLPRSNPIAHPSVMYRRQAILDAGGYRYRRYPANEDYELWCRLAARGQKLANLPRRLLRYRIHAGAMKSEKLRGIVRGTRLVKRHYFSGRMGWNERLRYWGEGALTALPAPLVLQLFMRLNYRRD